MRDATGASASDTGASASTLAVVEIGMVTRFRRITRRRAVLLRGPAGWGEFSPFAEYPPAVTRWWWAAAQEAAVEGWPAPRRDRVPVNTTVPAVDAATAHRMVAASGCRTAKVKVAEPGQALSEDLDRVEAVRDALGPDGHIRVDANMAWDVDTAVTALRALDRAAGGLEYAEQPCPTTGDLAALRRRIDVRIAADESLRTAADAIEAAKEIRAADAADVLIVKVQPLGGVRRCLAMVEAAGLPAVVSSAVETSVGLAAGVALAAALDDLPHACGLGTITLLEGDVTTDPLIPVDGALAVRPIVADPGLLERWAAPDPEVELDRFRAAAAEVGIGAVTAAGFGDRP